MTKPRPSAVGVAVDCTFAASLPASGSRSAKALVDCHRIDLALTEIFQPPSELRSRRVPSRIGIRQQAITQVLPKEQALHKADLLEPVAQDFFRLGELFFTIWRCHEWLLCCHLMG